MIKKLIVLLEMAFCLMLTASVSGQDPVRVKCDRFSMNVPSENVKCYQIDGNIPVAEDASPEEIAAAQVANTAIYIGDYSSLALEIEPQVTFYLIDDLGKTSFDLLDQAMSMSDIMDNIASGFTTAEESLWDLPFLPYQADVRTGWALPKQLDFENGSGIRSLAVFEDTVFSASSPTNLYYSFQGVSNDGAYYISAVFPVLSMEVNSRQAEEIDWNSINTNDITPSLDELDYYIRSIVIE